MEIKVHFLDKLRLEAKFDDFTVIADQPIRYKGDGSAPAPFDYFLASSALRFFSASAFAAARIARATATRIWPFGPSTPFADAPRAATHRPP